MVNARVYKYVSHFKGLPEKSNFQLVNEELPPIEDGEFIAEAIYFSIDTDLRTYMETLELGSTIIGQQVAMVTSSKNENFPVGSFVCGPFGWRTHTISNGEASDDCWVKVHPYLIPDFGDLPKSLSLSVLGIPGPKPGDTVVVSTAAGSVGSLVGQIARIKGCLVIGLTSSDEKGMWLIKELHFDYFINYTRENVDYKLSEVAPRNVDCYFDNIGGTVSAIVLKHMNQSGRIAVCGLLHQYNDKDRESGYDQFTILNKELNIEGFHVNRWLDRWNEGINQIFNWILNGEIKYKETVTEGFDNMFDAFMGMWSGSNVGKSIVKA